jgi:hypothetical protein
MSDEFEMYVSSWLYPSDPDDVIDARARAAVEALIEAETRRFETSAGAVDAQLAAIRDRAERNSEFARANILFTRGDIAGARRLWERVAASGHPVYSARAKANLVTAADAPTSGGGEFPIEMILAVTGNHAAVYQAQSVVFGGKDDPAAVDAHASGVHVDGGTLSHPEVIISADGGSVAATNESAARAASRRRMLRAWRRRLAVAKAESVVFGGKDDPAAADAHASGVHVDGGTLSHPEVIISADGGSVALTDESRTTKRRWAWRRLLAGGAAVLSLAAPAIPLVLFGAEWWHSAAVLSVSLSGVAVVLSHEVHRARRMARAVGEEEHWRHRAQTRVQCWWEMFAFVAAVRGDGDAAGDRDRAHGGRRGTGG